MHMHMHVHMHIHIHTYIDTYIDTHVHIHIHIYIHRKCICVAPLSKIGLESGAELCVCNLSI